MLGFVKGQWTHFLQNHAPLDQAMVRIRIWLPPVNFITLHYTYFTVVIFGSSLVFWGSSEPHGHVSYIDSLFLVTSAMTTTGLNTINLSDCTTWQQIHLWLLMIMGNPIFISYWTVLARKHAFEKRFEDIVTRDRRLLKEAAARGPIRNAILPRALTFSRARTEPSGDVPLTGLGRFAPPQREDAAPMLSAESRAPRHRATTLPAGASTPSIPSNSV